MIIGFNPRTKTRMTIVPDDEVLQAACAPCKYALSGSERHSRQRQVAERVIAELVLMKKNNRFTLSHMKQRWVVEALEREAQLQAILAALRKDREKEMALRAGLQVRCRRARLVRYGLGVLARRQRLQLVAISSTAEWGVCWRDRASQRVRSFLVADAARFDEIRDAFDVFDHGDGSIDASEFQRLCFEIGKS